MILIIILITLMPTTVGITALMPGYELKTIERGTTSNRVIAII